MNHRPRMNARTRRRLSMERLEPRVVLSASDLRITELVASNDGSLVDADGDSSDWLEVYNAGSTAVNLSGMYLTDSPGNLTRWQFPAGVTIPAGGYRIVFASNKNGVRPGGELHTNFALSADGEYLALVAADGVTVIDAYAPAFPPQVEDVSYGRATVLTGNHVTIIANGTQAKGWVPTSAALDATWRNVDFNDAPFNISGPTGFGYENNPGDSVNYSAEIATTVPSNIGSLYLRITFDLASLEGIDNLTLRMRYDDGFVAYVNGRLVASANAPNTPQWNSQATTSRTDSLAEQFQSFDASVAIPNLRIGQNVLAIHGLNLAGGSDMLVSPELVASSTMLATPEQVGYFDVPTPGYANGASAFQGFLDRPTFSVPHGFYTTPQAVSLAADAGAIIVYTTNGSTPAVNASLTPTNGTLYTGPINVSSTTTLRAMAFRADYKPSFVAASTYIFLDDVLNQSPTGVPPAGWPADGAVNGQRMNYGIDPDIVSLYGAQAVKDSLASLPSISISTDLANLFHPTTGIYVNALNDGREWERPASVELINPDGSPGFSVNAGLRIRGGYSRNDFNPKHAFRFYFRGEYGDGKLNYAMFGDEGLDEYDVLDLRTEQNYSWSSEGNSQNTFLREVFARDLQRDLGDPYTRSRYYHLYVDGQYFGVFMTQERVEENFAAAYFGGEPEDYDIIKHGVHDGVPTIVDEGNDAAWFQLFTLAQNLANSPAANADNYWAMQGLNPDGTRNPALPVLLDVDNLINYMLIIFYTGGYDTGISRFLGDNQANNFYAVYNRVSADQGFQFFMHDNEHSLGAEGAVHGSQFIDRTGPFNLGNQNSYAYFNPQYLHQDLLAHPEYRMRIIEKVQEYFIDNGPLTPTASIARMQERIPQIDPAIVAEAARWGDSQVHPPRNKSTWLAEVNWLLTTYFPSRTVTVFNQLRGDGLYVPRPVLSLPPGPVAPGSLLSMTPTTLGTIYYTTDGVTDPRLPGGAVNPAALAYSSPILLNASQTIKARLLQANGAWSVANVVSYTVGLQGDYDANGFVDGGDFLAWQRLLGTAATPVGSGADGDGSGLVDAGDLAAWQANFGAGETLAAAMIDASSEPNEDASSAGLSRSVAIIATEQPESLLLALSDDANAGGLTHAARHLQPWFDGLGDGVALPFRGVPRNIARRWDELHDQPRPRFHPSERGFYAEDDRHEADDLTSAVDAALGDLL